MSGGSKKIASANLLFSAKRSERRPHQRLGEALECAVCRTHIMGHAVEDLGEYGRIAVVQAIDKTSVISA